VILVHVELAVAGVAVEDRVPELAFMYSKSSIPPSFEGEKPIAGLYLTWNLTL
jgi:hypothetical protein